MFVGQEKPLKTALKYAIALPFVIFGTVLLLGLAAWAWATGNDPADSTNEDHPMDYRGD
jgi:hypothetical protein